MYLAFILRALSNELLSFTLTVPIVPTLSEHISKHLYSSSKNIKPDISQSPNLYLSNQLTMGKVNSAAHFIYNVRY
ncbi:hypothetical protein OPLHCY645_24770 [Clostridium tetani]